MTLTFDELSIASTLAEIDANEWFFSDCVFPAISVALHRLGIPTPTAHATEFIRAVGYDRELFDRWFSQHGPTPYDGEFIDDLREKQPRRHLRQTTAIRRDP